jgi:hypothetical protein
MSIVIFGSNGSMGKRYQTILNYLNIHHVDIDVSTDMYQDYKKIDGIIIATPTDTHLEFIKIFSDLKVPILCEKPLSTDFKEIEQIKALVDQGLNLTMMNQYKLLDDPSSEGPSFYNYFRHGNDGLYWDCMQIIGLARGSIQIHESSPVWTCMLNGKALSLSDMDWAYVQYVQDWIQNPGQDFNEILLAHQKTISYWMENGRQ